MKLKSYLLNIIALAVVLIPSLSLAAGVSLEPAIVQFEIGRNSVVNRTISYKNDTVYPKTIDLEVKAFKPDPQDATKPIFKNDDGTEITSPAVNWVKLAKNEAFVAAGGTIDIPVTLTVPDEILKDRIYLVVFATEKLDETNNSTQGSTIRTRVASIFIGTPKPELIPVSTEQVKDFWTNLGWWRYLILAIGIFVVLDIVVRIYRRLHPNIDEKYRNY